MKNIVKILKSGLFGAVITVLVAFIYRAYILALSGYAWNSLPPQAMVIDVMELHKFALWGGLGFGILRFLIVLFQLFRSHSSLEGRSDMPYFDIDEKIKALRSERADAYLEKRARENENV